MRAMCCSDVCSVGLHICVFYVVCPSSVWISVLCVAWIIYCVLYSLDISFYVD